MDLGSDLDQAKWQKIDETQKKDFSEYKVMRQHKKLDSTSFRYLVQPEGDSKPMGVTIQFTTKDTDPLKNVATVELRLNDDKIIGVQVGDDCFELIGN